MDARGLHNYKAQSLNTMTQGELLLLLMDELVKRLMRANIALEQGELQMFEASIQRCIDIVRYLDDTLDRRYEVSRGLHRLYDFFCYDLNRISLGRNKKELGKLLPMITDLRDTLRIAEKNASEGR